jgi:hypothetical protein
MVVVLLLLLLLLAAAFGAVVGRVAETCKPSRFSGLARK